MQPQVTSGSLSETPVIPITRRRIGWRAIGWAAAASVVVLAGFWQVGLFTQRAELVTHVNQTSAMQKITLDDGSVVWLQPHSRVQYQQPMPTNKRLLTLTGQAFFAVAKDPSRPFTVTANQFRTTALGTSFDIRAYGNDVRIALQTGKVRVQSTTTNRQWSLLPGQQLTGHPTDTAVIIGSFRPAVVLAWQTGSVAFDNEPLATVLTQLAAQYGDSIRFDRQRLARCFVTARFSTREPIESVLPVLLFPNQLQVKKINHVYVVSGSGCR